MSDLDAKLAEIATQYDDVQTELSQPEVSADPSEIRRLGNNVLAEGGYADRGVQISALLIASVPSADLNRPWKGETRG